MVHVHGASNLCQSQPDADTPHVGRRANFTPEICRPSTCTTHAHARPARETLTREKRTPQQAE
eukprot:262631-Chlamydomonas_euryale.AAC.1